jgi:ParB family chromosome partitioning protein
MMKPIYPGECDKVLQQQASWIKTPSGETWGVCMRSSEFHFPGVLRPHGPPPGGGAIAATAASDNDGKTTNNKPQRKEPTMKRGKKVVMTAQELVQAVRAEVNTDGGGTTDNHGQPRTDTGGPAQDAGTEPAGLNGKTKAPMPRAGVAPGEMKLVPIEEVKPDPDQPRTVFDEGKLKELADSIRELGIVQPLLVCFKPAWTLREPDLLSPTPEWFTLVTDKGEEKERGPLNLCKMVQEAEGRDKPYYQLIAGERRLRAAQMVGLSQVPVIVRDDDAHMRTVQMIENLQRENLSALEEAAGYERMLQERRKEKPGFKADDLAKELGVSRGTVYNRLGLLRLPDEVKEALKKGTLDKTAAGLIATVPDVKIREELLEEALDEYQPMSFRELKDAIEARCKSLKGAPWEMADRDLVPVRWKIFLGGAEVGGDIEYEGAEPDIAPTLRCAFTASSVVEKDGQAIRQVHVFQGMPNEKNGNSVIAGPMAAREGDRLVRAIEHGREITWERVQGGACQSCPWRSGNQLALDGTGTDSNICMRPACYQLKARAHWEREAEQKRVGGKKVLDAAEFRRAKKDLVSAAKHEFTQNKTGSWKVLCGKHAPQPVLVATEDGLQEYFVKTEAIEAAKKNGVKFYKETTPESAAKAKEKEAELKAKEASREALVKAHVMDLLPGIQKLKAEALVSLVWRLQGEKYSYMKLWTELKKGLKTDAQRLLGNVLAENSRGPLEYDGSWDKDRLALWKELGVDLVALEKAEGKNGEGKKDTDKHGPTRTDTGGKAKGAAKASKKGGK